VTEACREVTEACLEKTAATRKAWQEPVKFEIETELEEMNATESRAVAEHQEIPNDEAAVETIGALEDRSGDQQSAVGYRTPLKRRTQDEVLRGASEGPT
jgi:hypothetical protein